MIEWQRVPWTLWVWAVGVLVVEVEFVVVVAHQSGSTHIVTIIVTLALLSLWPYFMFRGVRWLWITTVGADALILVIDISTGHGTWHGDLLGIVQVLFLLLPVTRRFYSRQAAPARSAGA